MERYWSAPRFLTAPEWCSIIIASTLIAFSFGYLWTDLTYDEAVYLRLARTIAECGLPLRRSYEAFTNFRLFQNSPPLVLYITSISQMISPGDEVAARLVHLAVFVLPTYAMVWWVARERFGPWAAVAGLVVLLANGSYLRATTHVLLDVPLGLLACLGLVAFHDAACSPERRRSRSLIAGVTMLLSVWTKYQAVCVAAAVVLYVAYTLVTRGRAGLRSVRLPSTAVVLCGAVAAMTLFWFFWRFGGGEGLAATLTWNAERMSPTAMSAFDIARAVMTTARESEVTLGGAVLLLGAVSACVEHRHRGLVVILASYVAATVAFNLMFYRLPGAGQAYLHSAVPALALLAAPAAARLGRLAASGWSRALLVLGAIGIQLAGTPAGLYAPPRPNGMRVASGYICAVSGPKTGVLAETVAVDFYCGRPVRALWRSLPRELVLRSLEGTSGDDVSFVVISRKGLPGRLQEMRRQWDALLAARFDVVPLGAPDLLVFRRKADHKSSVLDR